MAFVRDHASRVYGHVPQPGDRRGIVFECSFKNGCMGGLSARQGAASCNKTFACCDQPSCGIILLLHLGGNKGQAAQASLDWSKNRNFLRCKKLNFL